MLAALTDIKKPSGLGTSRASIKWKYSLTFFFNLSSTPTGALLQIITPDVLNMLGKGAAVELLYLWRQTAGFTGASKVS